MTKLMVTIITFLLLQSASCRIRDQRHAITKLEYTTKVVPIISQEITCINTNSQAETKAIKFSAEIYVAETSSAESIFKHGIQNNTHDNEQGMELQGYLLNVLEFIQFLRETLQTDKIKLQENLVDGVEKFLDHVQPTKEVLTEAKLSSKNSELTINSIMTAIDKAVIMFSKMKIIVENKKTSNSELRIKLKEIFLEVSETLNEISSKNYNFRELVIHSLQLKDLIRQLSSNAKLLVKVISLQSGFKTVVEKTVKKLKTIENGIEEKVQSKITFSLLQSFYRGWFSKIIETIDDLDKQAMEHGVDAKIVMLDTLGILEFYRIVFQILAGKFF